MDSCSWGPQPARKEYRDGDSRQIPGDEIGIDSSTNSRERPGASSIATATPSKRPTTSSEENNATAGTNFAKGNARSDYTGIKSRLTPAAAMAPPFQPRTKAMVAANSFSGIANNSTIYSASFGHSGLWHGSNYQIGSCYIFSQCLWDWPCDSLGDSFRP